MSSALLALAQVFPPDRLLTGAAQLVAYESDALTAFRSRPAAIVVPESTEDVVKAVRICHEHRMPFVARGSGTSLSGGSLPVAGGVVLALNRLNRILRLDPDDRIAVVEPGVINLDVSKAAARYGLYYAPDPSSQAVCTIGGNIAFNSGGAHCLKYGMTSNHVLGLTVVLPDGEVAHLGGASAEHVGPDWTGMFVGGEGLFGVATEIVLRLMPKPALYKTVLASYRSVEAAGEAVARIVASGLLPGAIEIMDRLAIQAAEAAVQAGYPRNAAAVLIVELDGEAGQVEAELVRLREVIDATGADEIHLAKDEAERLRIWKGRKSAFSAVGRISPDYIVQDGVVPRGKLGQALAEIERIGQRHGLRVANVFHAGDGNLHPLILFDGREPGALERAERLAADIIDLCIALGGSITGEHGVGMEKRAFMPRLFAPDDLDLMWRIRTTVDFAELSNPGKMFPGDAEPGPVPVGPHPLERAGVISRV